MKLNPTQAHADPYFSTLYVVKLVNWTLLLVMNATKAPIKNALACPQLSQVVLGKVMILGMVHHVRNQTTLRRYILSQKTNLIPVINRSTYQPILLWLIVLPMFLSKVRKMTKVMKRSNQAPHPTQDTTRESNKNTINITNKSQEVSPFPAGDHKAVNNRRESMRNTRHK